MPATATEIVIERFGETLRTYRRAAGLTQEELAERAGVSPRSISGMERGEGATPRRDTVALLAKALELTPADRADFEALLVRGRAQGPRLVRDRPAGDEPPHNVPRSLDSFIGRESDMHELGPELSAAPLMTLLGAGGTGKTRLARELARRHVGDFVDGAWLVELAEICDPQRVPHAVAEAVGLRDFHARNTADLLIQHLCSKHLLLVLDNCEHLVEACATLVEQLLRECPCLHVLATSREPLAIKGEIVWLVRPLELPGPNADLCADEMMRIPAVRLFVERVRAVNPTFLATDQNAAPIARVCLAVDGIPLALELAAARVRMMSVEQLADRLEEDVHILRGTSRSRSPRHETIRATIDWSHDLLDQCEQMLLRRLAVFAGGWTLEMAEDVCSGPDLERAEILDLLFQLVDKSMVLVSASADAARYRLLGPIRQYALERLRLSGEESEIMSRLANTALNAA